MGKRKKLTEVEEFFVKGNVNSIPLEEMAKKLDCTKATLVPFYKPPEVKPDTVSQPVVMPEAKKEPIKVNDKTVGKVFPDGMVRGAFGRRRNAIVMTPEVAQMTDEIREKVKIKKNSPTQVHKPYGD